MNVTGRVRLRDLRSISPEELERARRICETIERIVGSRADFIARNQLDPSISLPASNWSPEADQPFLLRYQHIVKGDHDVINKLRLYAQFSSYDLATQSVVTHGRLVPAVEDGFDEKMAQLVPEPDPWVRRYVLITRHVPPDIVPRYPKVLGEIGWDIEGKPVNHDVYAYQERINLMHEAGLIDWLRRRSQESGPANILEIGGGYGGLAYALTDIIPGQINYFICDLPESLLSSSIYLGITRPEYRHLIYDGTDRPVLQNVNAGRAFAYLPNYMFDHFLAAGIKVDMAINTLSFPEMAESQVRYYANGLKKAISSTGVLFEQNEDGRWVGMLDCKPVLAEYFPYRKTIRSKSIPLLSKGQADVWSNRKLDDILDGAFIPFTGSLTRVRLCLWRLSCLLRWRSLGVIRLRQILHANVSPAMFARIKKWWNRLGGHMPA
ncbi:MAG: putative sugar O-methyltransferase [Verrucomicrobiota bacterium]